MIGKGRNDGENTDFLQHLGGGACIGIVFTINKIEKCVLIIIHVVDAHLKDALPFLFVGHDKLCSDVEMMERLHPEVVFLAIILHITHIMTVIIVIESGIGVGIELVL